METLSLTPKEHDRFWSKVDKTDGCWNWTGATSHGYGQFWLAPKYRRSHRVSYEIAKGPIPEGLFIDHMCHNRACVNPDHLRVVNYKQNREHVLGAQGNSKSGIRGVSRKTDRDLWQATVCHNRQRMHLGYFKTIEEATAAVVAKRIELFTHNDADRKAA